MAREAVIKSGWLRREELIAGSCSTWKKRWNVLSLNKLCWFKHHQSTEPISKCAIAAIESMSFGEREEGSMHVFTLTTARGTVRLAADSDEERLEWVNTLRTLVPKAKVALAQEMLMRKAKRKAAHELLHKLMRDAIESILRDSKRVAHLGTYRPYAQALIMCLMQVGRCVDDVAKHIGTGPPATACADALRASVDAANSAVAICVNASVQKGVVSNLGKVGKQASKMLSNSRYSQTDMGAREAMKKAIVDVNTEIKALINLLTKSGDRDAELDEAQQMIEAAVAAPKETRSDPLPGKNVQERIDKVLEKGEEFGTKLAEIREKAVQDPDSIALYGRETAGLMCELLSATSIIATECGYDDEDEEFMAKIAAGPQIPENATPEERKAAIEAYEASLGGISEFKLHQLQSLMAAAKGFAAATTNMIEVMKEIPGQETDPDVLARFEASTHADENALKAFMDATRYLDTTDSRLRNAKPEVDPEDRMQAMMGDISKALDGLGGGGGSSKLNFGGDFSEFIKEAERQQEAAKRGDKDADPLKAAARAMAAAAGSVLTSSATIQADIKATRGTGVYVQDKAWTEGLIGAAGDLGTATVDLVSAASNPDTPPEDILAMLRSGPIAAAATRLTAFTKAKANPDQEKLAKLDESNNAIHQATQQMLAATKQKLLEAQEAKRRLEMDSAPMDASIKEQQRLEYEHQAKIAKLETELDEARRYYDRLTRGL
eukprot:TRINITY_DN1806_c0_g1_i1.p1 TRINITY_DN1806_c0_g1~~TRINITY_DN1806_c0_g1_i1.p1  ORF type:complete len:722 (-),score=313.27 TRINITY_DN1806_c0_g1_i1:248-2413(-)